VLGTEDDGTGFQQANGNSTGMGIRIMLYRANIVGATLDLKSSAGYGTRVACTFNPTVRPPSEQRQKPE
jgi:two-component system, LuxR family, sensor kinase FixL